MAIQCLLVDDNDGFLRIPRELLERDGVDVVGVATTSADVLQQPDELRPDVALIDIMLGDELAHALTQMVPEPPHVIMISADPEEDLTDMIEASPAIGYLSKTRLSGSAIRALLKNADAAG